jgi:putative ABC transport system substrate-binding protein
MFNPETAPYFKFFMQVIETAAPSLGVQVIDVPVGGSADIEPALARFARQPNVGLMLLGSSFTRLHLKLITELAGRYRLPSISNDADFAKYGGLMDYGPNNDRAGQYRQAATYVDRILKGEKPADLPVQAPTHYRFVINLKTAKALGLDIPLGVLNIVDEVIE